MPLNPSALQNGFEDLFGNQPKNAAEAAQRWAQLYVSYASNALSCAGGAPTNLVGSLLEVPLLAAFSNPLGPAPATASAIATALVTFWTPVIFSGPVPGVTIPVGALALQGLLLGIWPGITLARASVQQAAAQHATAFDAATRLVIVSHPIVPTPCVAPIS